MPKENWIDIKKNQKYNTAVGQRNIKSIINILMFLGLVIWLFPFFWMIATSLKEQTELFTYPPTLIPRTANLEAFMAAISGIDFFVSFTNSMIISFGAVVLQSLTCSLAAYPLARMEFKGRDFMFLFFVSTMMVPLTVTITANFIILRRLNWIDTYYALIVPFGASGLGIFLFRQFFRTIPDDIEDAAKIDGCGKLRVLFSIMFPMAKPAFAALAVFVWQAQWNQFLWPLIMTNSRSLWVVQVAISTFQDSWGTNHAEMMAAATLAALPPLIIFAFLQKYFIQGIARTGLK
ncbi:MAG: carbohydrate ABC transporter permease [Eubacteriales bacterium]